MKRRETRKKEGCEWIFASATCWWLMTQNEDTLIWKLFIYRNVSFAENTSDIAHHDETPQVNFFQFQNMYLLKRWWTERRPKKSRNFLDSALSHLERKESQREKKIFKKSHHTHCQPCLENRQYLKTLPCLYQTWNTFFQKVMFWRYALFIWTHSIREPVDGSFETNL